MRSLYVHIPFCIKKCLYCDFNSYSNNNLLQDAYIDSLLKELSNIKQKRFETIFVGGGTPTILSFENTEKLLKKLVEFYPTEFTFEANPGTLNKEKLSLIREYGVNRISIGLQAWQDNLLKKLGRVHTQKEFFESYSLARKLGFNNINIDIMFGIPNQSLLDWQETLYEVIKLKPEHISSYGLIIEEGTPFYNLYNDGKLCLAEEEEERDMYHLAIKELGKNGYEHYEISNFSLPNKECNHNITYWRLEDYLGVGAGAHSFIHNKRYSNFRSLEEYIKGIKENNIIDEISMETTEDLISEYMFLGLRMIKGISKEAFYEKFKLSVKDIYEKEISMLINKGLLIENDTNIHLSSLGIDFSNQVFVEFLK